METRPKNQNEQQKATKSIIHSFASTLDLWKVVDIKSNEKPERATKGNEKQRKSTKSNEQQQKAKVNIGAGETKTGNKKPKRTSKGTKLVHMETRLNDNIMALPFPPDLPPRLIGIKQLGCLSCCQLWAYSTKE